MNSLLLLYLAFRYWYILGALVVLGWICMFIEWDSNPAKSGPFNTWDTFSQCQKHAAEYSCHLQRAERYDVGPYRAYTARPFWSDRVYVLEFKEPTWRDCFFGRRLYRSTAWRVTPRTIKTAVAELYRQPHKNAPGGPAPDDYLEDACSEYYSRHANVADPFQPYNTITKWLVLGDHQQLIPLGPEDTDRIYGADYLTKENQ